jgi:hypothetical protein
MVSEIRIYYEGDKALKPGFDAFFSRIRRLADNKKCRFQLISTGAKWQQDFHIAIKSHATSWNILLIDSEGPAYSAIETCEKNSWDGVHATSIFWMVEMMESWFHADKDKVASYYGKDFKRNALAANPQVEEIPKKDLLDGLKTATKDTPKGPYHKTAHAPKLLACINPDLVRKAAPNCDRLFDAIEKELS